MNETTNNVSNCYLNLKDNDKTSNTDNVSSLLGKQ